MRTKSKEKKETNVIKKTVAIKVDIDLSEPFLKTMVEIKNKKYLYLMGAKYDSLIHVLMSFFLSKANLTMLKTFCAQALKSKL